MHRHAIQQMIFGNFFVVSTGIDVSNSSGFTNHSFLAAVLPIDTPSKADLHAIPFPDAAMADFNLDTKDLAAHDKDWYGHS
jgi:hypothetical protein